MGWHNGRRVMAVLAAATLLLGATGLVVAAPDRLLGQASSQRPEPSVGSAVSSGRGRSPLVRSVSSRGAERPSVQLTSPDVTPTSHLGVLAAGFLGGEPLAVGVADGDGHPYGHTTVHAGADGRVRVRDLSLPPGLASGAYQVEVAGSTSHRRASASFQMYDVPPTVALDVYSSAPGRMLHYSGSGFLPGETVEVYLGKANAPRASSQATAAGAVSGDLEVPALAAGRYRVTLVGLEGESPVSMGFTLQGFAPWIVLDRYVITAGEGLGYIGQGFASNEPVLVYVNSSAGTPAMRVVADSSGRIIVQDSWIPSADSGHDILICAGQRSHATAQANFTVQGQELTTEPNSNR